MSRWQKMFGSRRAAIDRALLASMEREIANEERLRAKQATADPGGRNAPEQSPDARIARAFGRPF